jgi:hypothetical protein
MDTHLVRHFECMRVVHLEGDSPLLRLVVLDVDWRLVLIDSLRQKQT